MTPNTIRVYLKTPSNVVYQVFQDNKTRIVLWKVLPGIAVALGVDGDLLETILESNKDRWEAATSDGEYYRAYPVTTGAIESEILPRLQDAGTELFVVERIVERP